MNKILNWLLTISVLILAATVFIGGEPVIQPERVVERVERVVEKAQDKLGGWTSFDKLSFGTTAGVEWTSLALETGTSTAFVYNKENYTKFVDLAVLTTTGVASSSFRFYVATTSGKVMDTASGAGLHRYTAMPNASLISNFLLATSSIATTTSSLGSQGSLSGPERSAVVPWKAGEYIGIVLQTTCAASSDSSTAGPCEAASSTARGFNVDVLLRTFATSTKN